MTPKFSQQVTQFTRSCRQLQNWRPNVGTPGTREVSEGALSSEASQKKVVRSSIHTVSNIEVKASASEFLSIVVSVGKDTVFSSILCGPGTKTAWVDKIGKYGEGIW